MVGTLYVHKILKKLSLILQELFDVDYLNGRVDSLLEAFPEEYFTHAMAVKANPLR